MQHSTFFPDCFHRVTIKGLCVKDGKVLLVRESKELSGKWEMPGGGLDFGENVELALRREIEEEMGLKVSKVSKKPIYIWTHRYENNRRKIGWYYSIVLAYRVEFENLQFVPTDECEAIEFFSKGQLKNKELNEQTKELADLFDPNDFTEPF
jgi:8-oxo-dGTP diphosphatase